MKKFQLGVSPAFLLSLYGEIFSPEDVVQAVPRIAAMGFNGFQCEVVSVNGLTAWEQGVTAVADAAQQHGLRVSAFVAHFMMDLAFMDATTLLSEGGIAEMDRVCSICDHLDTEIIVVPLGPFRGATEAKLYTRLVEKLRQIATRLKTRGYRMALEVQPGALVCGAPEINRLCTEVGYQTGYNYDTGHANASGCTEVEDFPQYFGKRLYGTHLCDNDGVVNQSLRPTLGTLDWPLLVKNLAALENPPSLDLEIFTTPREAEEQYRIGKAYLCHLLQSL